MSGGDMSDVEPENDSGAEGETGVQLQVKFRNYIPRDPKFRKKCLPRPSAEALEKRIEQEIADAVKWWHEQDVLTKIAPKKPNWDLKRDISKRLKQLENKTNRAIVQLVSKKLQEQPEATASSSSSSASAAGQTREGQQQGEAGVGPGPDSATLEEREAGAVLERAMERMEELDKEDMEEEEEEEGDGGGGD
uniref:Cwf18 pre-mRNA splicing factor n=1 Tax=Chromera velia CCMP2878 TaxID=1169474 RepID=A0A0G4HUT1_9ALVE|eukprot:Cvel_32010.t1-p1 / transcript=Cvel_32010.t1 / gene=Cvel_32010 / organism=Chromera_velia_CCMP2878 / gene_product=Coiled-coil domain-containing protein 12, putative / transcript_product=Coiled-coil domain-containing protein 12, putative / location=Cvel_scaffold4880:2566-3339(+) / protein_length=191 / sequence_SO=supercontig / SO=protein_coding / is_pseudo=false